jgi:hypothetical protein
MTFSFDGLNVGFNRGRPEHSPGKSKRQVVVSGRLGSQELPATPTRVPTVVKSVETDFFKILFQRAQIHMEQIQRTGLQESNLHSDFMRSCGGSLAAHIRSRTEAYTWRRADFSLS